MLSPGTALVMLVSSLMKAKPEDAWNAAARRKKNEADMAIAGRGWIKDVSAEDFRIPGPAAELPVRLYRKAGSSSDALILYYHGGGWVIGSLDANDSIARGLCRASGAKVLSVAYRLAPEAPYPAAVDDAVAAYEWALANPAAKGWSTSRIHVSGDSAGANLATVLSLIAKERRMPQPRGQILLYPATDISRFDTPSYLKFGTGYLLTRADVEWFSDCYCPKEKRTDPHVSPLLAADLSGLAPALIFTAQFDVLRDEGEAYAKRLSEAGVRVTQFRARGVTHAFASLSRFNPLAAGRAFKAAATFVNGGV